eukprot:g27273.t1
MSHFPAELEEKEQPSEPFVLKELGSLTLRCLLGCGGFGRVQLVEDPEGLFAWKASDKRLLEKSAMTSNVVDEKRVLGVTQICPSPFIVKYYGCCHTRKYLYFKLEALLDSETAGGPPVGCLCCRVRGDLVDALRRLAHDDGEESPKRMDCLLVECSGLSEVLPVAQTFFSDAFVQASFRLDSVLCVCDVSTFGELEGDAAGGRESVVERLGNDLLRLKGVLLTEGGRLVVQGVGGHIEISDPSERVSEGDGDGAAGANGTAASSSAPASSRLVLIGRVGEEALRRELKEGFEKVDQEVLVRKIAAVETLGSASVICSDKTGTLTEGKMTMVGMYAAGTTYEVTGKGFDPEVGGVMREDGQDGRNDLGVKSNLLTVPRRALWCAETDEAGVMKWTPKGNSSEAPIVVAARKVGLSETIAGEYPRVLEVPFSSSRKMMLTVSKVGGSHLCQGGMPLPPGTNYLTVCKGVGSPSRARAVVERKSTEAPNYIIDLCCEQLNPDGSVAKLSDADKSKILKIVDGYSARALRVLAIAARPMSKLPYDENNEDVTTDQKFDACRQQLRLMGLVASIDPERDGVPDSVVAARGAGIRVVMITGDYLLTAIAIAKNVNILQDTDDVETSAMDCASLRPNGEYLSNQEMDLVTCSTRVFARAKPEEKDKLEIVKSIQRQGQVAAMTGDGVNDAPALNQADIGVAMGIQGTEVAKGASDMVLTDDNFCSIVNAVEKGRAIYSGIQKFVAFIMSVHIAEVMQIFICIVIGIPVMRTPLQILFLILVTDLPPSIALGMEPGEAHILKMRPRPKDWELAKAQTVAFISLVWSENIRAYISRSFTNPMWHDILGNKHMQKAIIMAQVCLYVAVLTPYLSDRILGLRGLEIGIFGWALAIAGPVGCFILSESCKLISAYQARKHQESLAMSEAVAAPAKPIKVAGGGVKKGVKHVEPEPKRRSWFSCCMGGMF